MIRTVKAINPITTNIEPQFAKSHSSIGSLLYFWMFKPFLRLCGRKIIKSMKRLKRIANVSHRIESPPAKLPAIRLPI